MRKTGNFLAKLWNDESGISSVEYALLLAFVAAGIILGAEALSNAVVNEMEGAASCISTGNTSLC
jgi:Flp pilus assembly pilin Flp